MKNNDLKKILDKISDVEWEIQTFNAYPLYIDSVATLSGFTLPWGEYYHKYLWITDNGTFTWHYDKVDYERIGKLFWAKILKPADLEKLILKHESIFLKQLKAYHMNIDTFELLSNKSLLMHLSKGVKLMADSVGGSHIIEAASFYAEHTHTKSGLLANAQIEADDLSFIIQAGIYADKLSKKNLSSQDLLDEVNKKYSWIKSSYLGVHSLDFADIERLIESARKYKHTKRKLYKSDFEKNLSRLISWQDKRKAFILQSISALEVLVKVVAERYKISPLAIKHILPEEVHKLSQIKFRSDLQDRIEGMVCYIEASSKKNYHRIILTGKEAKEFAGKYSTSKTDNSEALLTGKIAQTGKVTGIARVCVSIESIRNFKQGEILIASMTRPEYLSAMKKAVAFVTDEGGITCHAAIIAREMKKPCIIGTKIATKVLKDGDMLEVDADNGVVRIISKKQKD